MSQQRLPDCMCQHCGAKKVNRPKRLCYRCYYTPGVREQCEITSKFARRGVIDFMGQGAMPSEPTNTIPGTPERIAVLEERASLGQRLWHPLDFSHPPVSMAGVTSGEDHERDDD